jgi:hypothetical protein
MVVRHIVKQHEGEFNMRKMTLILAGLLATTLSLGAQAQEAKTFEVTITNITKEQIFTPLLLATHTGAVSLFTPGQPASDELEMQAEGGNPMPLKGLLDGDPGVLNTAVAGGLLMPGQSVTVEIRGNGKFNRLSITSMLIPTNDAIVGLRSMKLPSRSVMAAVPAFDAGTELNDEDCDNIPGPDCGGEGFNMAGGEGYVYISNGISGVGDLASYAYDWRNPVARVVVKHIE